MITLEELRRLYHTPLLELIAKAHQRHIEHNDIKDIKLCALISIKTGGCPEDCAYCPQSARYQTGVQAQKMLSLKETLEKAKALIKNGAKRICLGLAIREVRDNNQFEELLQIVEEIAKLEVEVCCCAGMLKPHHAERLKKAGLFAYNHNLDSSSAFYKTIITTRTYEDRLDTLKIAGEAGLSVCCGGILGMGESDEDRIEFLYALTQLDPPPESIPINRLIRIPGTPLESRPPLAFSELVRVIATARCIFPTARIRLAAGREGLSFAEQTLCFLAGVNSIFIGEVLLTAPNSPMNEDQALFEELGIPFYVS